MSDVATVEQGQPSKLTDDETAKLARLERVVEDNILGFRQAGVALMAIRELRLYREKHRTFDDYVRARWNMGKSHAHRMIDAAGVLRNLELSPIGDAPLPTHESQVRPLSKLPPEQQGDAWAEAVRESGGQPTAAAVQDAVDKRRATQKAMNSSESFEWYSPAEIAAPARRVVGWFDLDPASSPEANLAIHADRIFTIEDDGLAQSWRNPDDTPSRVWLNPPGGIDEQRQSRVAVWFERLQADFRAGHVAHGFGLVFNAQTGNKWFYPLWDYPLCFFKGRTAYRRPGGGVGEQPQHGSALFYLGPNIDKFVEEFEPLGRIVLPRGTYSEAL